MSAVQKEGRRIYARERTSAKATIAQFNQQSVHSDSQKTNFLNYPLYFWAMQIIWVLYFQGLCAAVREISAVNLIG